MARCLRSGPILTLSLLLAAPTASDGGPAARYMGAFWYDLKRPVESLRIQVYDLDRGEFDRAAVDRWLGVIRAQYPGHGSYVREIRLEDGDGATEAEQLARAIAREKRRWAEVQRRSSATIPRMIGIPATRAPGLSSGRGGFDRPSPGSSGVPLHPPSSPFPYPYRAAPR